MCVREGFEASYIGFAATLARFSIFTARLKHRTSQGTETTPFFETKGRNPQNQGHCHEA